MSLTKCRAYCHAARRDEEQDYFLPFLVVFFEKTSWSSTFFFLAAMALGTSFLVRNVKLENFWSTFFCLRADFFPARVSRARDFVARG